MTFGLVILTFNEIDGISQLWHDIPYRDSFIIGMLNKNEIEENCRLVKTLSMSLC